MSDKAIEAAARALCEKHIRYVRRWDTELAELEKTLPDAVDYSWQDYAGQATAAIRAYNAAMEAEGFVLVPVEPTEAMARIGGEYTAYASDSNMTQAAAEVWESMIAARPRAEGD